jgi:uncharacterized protein (DUF924 family)
LRSPFESTLEFAAAHQEIVQRFGRFPARNRALGRVSTAAERKYLESGAADFGQ